MHHNRVEFEPVTENSLQLDRPGVPHSWRRLNLPTYPGAARSTLSIVGHGPHQRMQPALKSRVDRQLHEDLLQIPAESPQSVVNDLANNS
jgi:hypothetical protein